MYDPELDDSIAADEMALIELCKQAEANAQKRIAASRAPAGNTEPVPPAEPVAPVQRGGGPRTPAGKQRSSNNSLRHGLTAKRVVLSREDQAEFDQLLADLTVDRNPRGELELQLTAEIAACTWRLSRARTFETDHFEVCEKPFQRIAAKQLDLILRYIGSIERQLNRAIVRLDQTQAARRKWEQAAQAEANARAAAAQPEPRPKALPATAPFLPDFSDLPHTPEFVSSSATSTPPPPVTGARLTPPLPSV